tara:strand:+ start:3613 stop:3945 length:333 start_codon:yes stop_codon:yes gene_type:complete
MQVAFQTDNISEKKSATSTVASDSLRLESSNINFRNNQPGLMSHKAQNENYSNARIYSPYLSPSSAVVMDMQIRQIDIDTIYVHNVARTKYFNISKPTTPVEHFKVNLLA